MIEDYTTFVGDSAATLLLPEAVRRGAMLPGGAGRRLNRFSTATLAAHQFAIDLAPGRAATIRQGLLYVTDERLVQRFRRSAESPDPSYEAVSAKFAAAAKQIVAATPGARELCDRVAARTGTAGSRYFALDLPHDRLVSLYANSVWTGVNELYETCRAHGKMLADGIELGTRDRAQDMWPKMKEDPARVRADLVHVLGLMYRTSDPPPAGRRRLTLREKLHGMFPRQYPSVWRDRTREVDNDNRPYTDSPLWLINSLVMYVRETGDLSILDERVGSVRLTDPDHPEQSGIVGSDETFSVLEVVFEIFGNFQRSVDDSPYGLPQVLYGGWCDPLDMIGTSRIGDPRTRSQGRGTNIRLAGHLFECLVDVIDLCATRGARRIASRQKLGGRIPALQALASAVRRNTIMWAWEPARPGAPGGFVGAIHELRRNGRRPDYRKGQRGYTLGSLAGDDYDRRPRRELASQAYGLGMLATRRDYLEPVPDAEAMIDTLLRGVDERFFDPKLGLMLWTPPIANTRQARDMVGRMGIVPAYCAENGQYHHSHVFMTRNRLDVPGEADTAWRHFKCILSPRRDESLGGPFEAPCNCYASDPRDPHFGKSMYHGLSGSIDWMIEVFARIAGVELALQDPDRPDLRVEPNLPAELGDTLRLRRVVHVARPHGGYREVPLSVAIRRQGAGRRLKQTRVRINGRPAARAEVARLATMRRVDVEIVRVYD